MISLWYSLMKGASDISEQVFHFDGCMLDPYSGREVSTPGAENFVF
jgi:hypothetical protein